MNRQLVSKVSLGPNKCGGSRQRFRSLGKTSTLEKLGCLELAVGAKPGLTNAKLSSLVACLLSLLFLASNNLIARQTDRRALPPCKIDTQLPMALPQVVLPPGAVPINLIQQPQFSQPQVAQPNIVPPSYVPGAVVHGSIPIAGSPVLRKPDSVAGASPVDHPEPSQLDRRAMGPSQIVDEISSIRRQLGGGLSQYFDEVGKHWQARDKIDGRGSQSESPWNGMVENGFEREVNRLATDRSDPRDSVVGLRNPQLVDEHWHVKQRSPSQTERPSDVSTDAELSDPWRASPSNSASRSLSHQSQDRVFENDGPIARPFPQRPVPMLSRAGEHVAVASNLVPVVSNSDPAEQLRTAARTLDQIASQLETTGLYEEADQVRAQAHKFWLKSRTLPGQSSR